MTSLIPPKPSDVTWTDDQWKAIMAKGQDILVAAAAGSGKTAVLIERMIKKILSDEDPVNVDELLVVTFTNASAAEMKHRMGEALEKAISEDPTSKHLRKQLSLLNKASISTIHSFCLDVIRKYYYKIGLDPGFRIADETEAQLLRDEAMENLFEEEYGKADNTRFFDLVEMFSNDRSDVALQEIVGELYNFAQSNASPSQYLKAMVAMYEVDEATTSMEDLPFYETLMFDLRLQLQGARGLLETGLELTKLPDGPSVRADNFVDDLRMIERLERASEESWNALAAELTAVTYTKIGTCRKGQFDEKLVERTKKLRDQAKKIVEGLREELFSRRPDSFIKDMRLMKEAVQTLVDLVATFANRFAQMKQEKGLVDFSDLEHYCLEILSEQGARARGEYVPTQEALNYQNHFKEVLVDEYQDVNLVQEAIIRLVTTPEEARGNLFMVGDVKQSIYRFRLAEPNLFLNKYNRFTVGGEESGLRIDLAKNFRSRGEVLAGTNYLFKQIMGVKVGEIDYDEAAELVKGASYPEETAIPVELSLIHSGTIESDTASETEEDSDSGQSDFSAEELEQSQLEARLIAQKIKTMIAARSPIYNPKTKTTKPAAYRDMVILLRSMTWAPAIMEELKDQGIPVYANLSNGYFEATEVAVMMSLLHVIDNPYQDIPLASVLRSPIVGLNEEELAVIRTHARTGMYYDAVKKFAQTTPRLEAESAYEKVRMFLEQLEKWRSYARQGSLSELIWKLYRATGFFDFVGGLPGGKQRQANLRALYDRARQYEETSFRGLFRFLRFVERMRDRGDDLGAARALGENEDVVRIMTIHSSKGLEFPVVFVAGLARNFNAMDLRKAYLLDKELGFAASYVDPVKRISYASLPQLAFKRKKRLELLAEEMRVLYVALTRAKEYLFLIASVKDAEKKLADWEQHVSESNWLLREYDRANAKGYLDWIGPSLIRHRDTAILRGDQEIEHIVPTEIHDHRSRWNVEIIDSVHLASNQEETPENEEENFLQLVEEGKCVPARSDKYNQIRERLTYQYDYLSPTQNRSKQSVSEVKRQQEVVDEASGTDLVKVHRKPLLDRPRFMQAKTLTSAERGTAMHAVMQHIDLFKPVTPEIVEQQLDDMVARELLTLEQKEVIDVEQIVAFFTTPIGKQLQQSAVVKREVPFSLRYPASKVYPDWEGKEEAVLIQGVIDCVFETEQGLVLLDFKTDRIDDRYKGGLAEAEPILKERYRSQMELYGYALETIWKRPLHAKYLFFFDGAYCFQMD